MTKIGILHPGEMGISIAASAIHSGHQVYWTSEHRSDKTHQRAAEQNLIDIHSLSELCQVCDVIVCICPPHAAEDIAGHVTGAGFGGFYLEANAISPERAKNISQMMEEKNIHFIDGGIIGGPAWKPGETRLYLSGKYAEVIADCFKNGPLETRIIGDEVGRASALKMCYAAYSKGTTALIAAVLATAESLGVRQELYQQWESDERGLSEQFSRRVERATTKAWRFEGEMKEIAATFQNAGLPNGFHEAAAEMYHRMAGWRKRSVAPGLDEILAILGGKSTQTSL